MPKRRKSDLARVSRKVKGVRERRLHSKIQASQERLEKRQVERILLHRKHTGNKKTLYLVKWKDYPKSEATWEPEDSLMNCQSVLDAYHKRKVEHIIHYRKRKGETQYLVKWKDYPQSEATWELKENLMNFNKSALDAYHKRKIQKVVFHREIGGKCEYLIKWEGFLNRDNSWETPETCMHLQDFHMHVNKYWHRKQLQANRKKKNLEKSQQYYNMVKSLKENAVEEALVKRKPKEEANQNRERSLIDSNEDNNDDSPLQNVNIDKYLIMWKVLYPKVDVQEQRNIYQESKGSVRQTMNKMRLLNEERKRKEHYVVDHHVPISDETFDKDYDDKRAAVEQDMMQYLISKHQQITGNHLSPHLELQMQQQLQQHHQQQQQPPVAFDDDDMEPSFLIKICLLNSAISSLHCQQCGLQSLKFVKSGESLLSEFRVKCTECTDIRHISTSKSSTNNHFLNIGGGEYIPLEINTEARPVIVPISLPIKKINEAKNISDDTETENISEENSKSADSAVKSVVKTEIVDEIEKTEVKIEIEQYETGITDISVADWKEPASSFSHVTTEDNSKISEMAASRSTSTTALFELITQSSATKIENSNAKLDKEQLPSGCESNLENSTQDIKDVKTEIAVDEIEKTEVKIEIEEDLTRITDTSVAG